MLSYSRIRFHVFSHTSEALQSTLIATTKRLVFFNLKVHLMHSQSNLASVIKDINGSVFEESYKAKYNTARCGEAYPTAENLIYPSLEDIVLCTVGDNLLKSSV
jgi:hypothetical protein